MSISKSDLDLPQETLFRDLQQNYPGRLACRCLNCITPPHILKKLLENSDAEVRKAALNTLLSSAKLLGERNVRNAFAATAVPANGNRTIFDTRNSTDLQSATMIRSESSAPASDGAGNRAFDGFGKTRDFYKGVFNRNSIDGHGMRLNGFVHRGVKYNNAFWDGQEMVFGDGDGVIFTDFTQSLDVIAHELTHGVTQFTANLSYHNQSGALNESIFGCIRFAGEAVVAQTKERRGGLADWGRGIYPGDQRRCAAVVESARHGV